MARERIIERSGRLVCPPTQGFWAPTLTALDPLIPHLSLETAVPPPPVGGLFLRALMGVGLVLAALAVL